MSLRARIRRLERDVEWLRWWGRLRAVEMRMKMIEIQKAMEKAKAATAMVRKPILREARAQPHLEERPARPRLERCEPAPPPRPPPPPPAPDPAFHPYDPPEHMQIRPVRWRHHGPDDDDADDMQGRCLVDYDPLADEDDDDG